MIIAPVVLIILPPDYFDQGESICPSVAFFGRECFGCGTTRGMMHLVHFDFKTAWNYNKLVFFLAPFLAYFYYSLLRKFIARVKNNGEKPLAEKKNN